MRYSLIFTFLSICSSLASPSVPDMLPHSINPLERTRAGLKRRQERPQFPILRERASTPQYSIVPVTQTTVKTVNAASTRTISVTAYATATKTQTVTKTVTNLTTVYRTVTQGVQGVAPTTTSKPTTTKASSTKATSTAAKSTTISASNVPLPFPTARTNVFKGVSTWYYTGLGACGWRNTDSDYIVAVSEHVFNNWPGATLDNPNNNPICGRKLRARYNGNWVTATVADYCVGCGWKHIDFSPAAFKNLTDLDTGMMDITWFFV